MERHVWTRHVRELLKFKPHVRYIANYHKVHVDRYVLMHLVEEDEASTRAAPTSTPASPSQSVTSSVLRDSVSDDESSTPTSSSGLRAYRHPSSTLSSGYSSTSNLSVAQKRASVAGMHSSSAMASSSCPNLYPTAPRGHDSHTSYAFHNAETSSEDEGFATPPHEVLIRMKYDRGCDQAATDGRQRVAYYSDRYAPYAPVSRPHSYPHGSYGGDHMRRPSDHNSPSYDGYGSRAYAATAPRPYMPAEPLPVQAASPAPRPPKELWRPW